MKILFVCLGNICRSPLAEALFIHKIKEQKIAHRFDAASCGTANYHVGDRPDPRTIRNAKQNGITIDHIGRQLAPADLKNFDMILAMDSSNYANILRLKGAPLFSEKIHLMREFDSIGKGEDVPDPWPGGDRGFQEVFEILDRAVDGLVVHLKLAMGAAN